MLDEGGSPGSWSVPQTERVVLLSSIPPSLLLPRSTHTPVFFLISPTPEYLKSVPRV